MTARWFGSGPIALVACLAGAGCFGVETAVVATPVVIWIIGAEASLIVGDGEDPTARLSRVRDAVRLTDGRIAVVDATQELKIFGTDGVLLHTFGGRGRGAGEFEFAQAITVMAGGALVVWDPVLQRATWFDPDVGFIQVVVFPAQELRDRYRAEGKLAEVTDVLPNGRGLVRILEQAPDYRPDDQGVFRQEVGFGVTPFVAAGVDSLGSFAGEERAYVATDQGPIGFSVLNARGVLATTGARSSAICLGDQASPAVECFGLEGRERTSLRWEADPVLLGGNELERLREAFRGAAARRYPTPTVDQILEWIPAAPDLPYFRQLHIDATDHVWVVPPPSGGGDGTPARARIFAPSGALAAVAEWGPGDVVDIGSDYVLAVLRDEVDVETVRVFPLHR